MSIPGKVYGDEHHDRKAKDIALILGMEWLVTLGEVKSDWKKKTMILEHNGKTVTYKSSQ